MGGEDGIDSDIRCGFQLRRSWWRIARLADRQHRVVARRQLLKGGLSPWQVDRLVASGQLQLVHHGIYAVGHRALGREGEWMAAVLAAGSGGVLFGVSAAMNWEIVGNNASLPRVASPAAGRRRPGVIFHRAELAADEVTRRNGIPTTTVARTLLDLAATLEPFAVERALAQARYRRYPLSPSLPRLLDRHRGERGAGVLRAIVAAGNAELGPSESPLEDRFLRFLDRRGLERPELNVPLDLGDRRIRVDCLWRSPRLAVELDGRAGHLRVENFESDRSRDRRLSVLGWRPIRITSEQLRADPDGLEADLLALGVSRQG